MLNKVSLIIITQVVISFNLLNSILLVVPVDNANFVAKLLVTVNVLFLFGGALLGVIIFKRIRVKNQTFQNPDSAVALDFETDQEK